MREPSVPVVLFGRYSTLHGTGTFVTLPIDATPYESITLQVWRGEIAAMHSFLFVLEESTDQQAWFVLASGDPGQDTEVTYSASLSRSWIRGKVTQAGVSSEIPTVSLRATGDLHLRRR